LRQAWLPKLRDISGGKLAICLSHYLFIFPISINGFYLEIKESVSSFFSFLPSLSRCELISARPDRQIPFILAFE
jgi:hypothetical protein